MLVSIDSRGHFSFSQTIAKHKLVEGLFRRLLLPEVYLNNLNNNLIISSSSSPPETIKEEEWIWIECV